MKVEQILYTRVGNSEIGAGWQSRCSERFDTDAEKGCVYQFNCIVDSILDKGRKTPECLSAIWHTGKKLCSARAVKTANQGVRGNILAQAYTVNENEYISVFSKPAEFVCISEFSDELIENPPVLDSLPPYRDVSLKEVCRKYSISSQKMLQLMILVLSASLKKNIHKKALRIVVGRPLDELCDVSREVMSVIYSFMPCAMRLNTSYASYAHPKLGGMTILFTNEKQDNYYYNLDSGEWSWPADMMIADKGMAKVFIQNQANADFQKDIEDFVLQSDLAYNIQWETMMAAYLYASFKNSVELNVSEDELFKALAMALKNNSSGIAEDYLAMLLRYYLERGGKVSANHGEALMARYNKTNNTNLKQAIDFYNVMNYVNDFSDQKFSKFCSLQRTAPDLYNKTIKSALDAGAERFLNKVAEDIVKSEETYAAFVKSVKADTKERMYIYMLKNVYLDESGKNYEKFSNLRRKVSGLYGELHKIALLRETQLLKNYYMKYLIPYASESFDILVNTKETFVSGFDNEMRTVCLDKLVSMFAQMCEKASQADLFTRYKNAVDKLCAGSSFDARAYENKGKEIFWKNFTFERWKYNDSYGRVFLQGYPACDLVRRLEGMVKQLDHAMRGNRVYDDILTYVVKSNSYNSQEKANIIRQFKICAERKNSLGNVDDMILLSMTGDGQVDMEVFSDELEKGGSNVNYGSVLSSEMLAYAVSEGAPRKQVIGAYENLMVNKNIPNKKVLEAYKIVCEKRGISLKQIENDISKKSSANVTAAVVLATFTAICLGIGFGTIMEIWSAPFVSMGSAAAFVKIAVIIVLSMLTALPAVKVVRGVSDMSAGMTIAVTAVFSMALTMFGCFFGFWAIGVAAAALAAGILLI